MGWQGQVGIRARLNARTGKLRDVTSRTFDRSEVVEERDDGIGRSCGYGCLAALPAGKVGFTTIELNSNHLATAPPGQQIRAVATPVHRGRTTQVWDAVVTSATQAGDPLGRPVAVFRCTQMLLDGIA